MTEDQARTDALPARPRQFKEAAGLGVQVSEPCPPNFLHSEACLSRAENRSTSRCRIRVSGRPVCGEREAVALFIERATAYKARLHPDDGAVVEICRRLDCLPLALELAAARIKALSSSRALLKRLDKRLPLLTRRLTGRHRNARGTLRATIAWSYELLAPGRAARLLPPRCIRRRLHARRGRRRRAKADSRHGSPSLIDKSLLRREGDRYSHARNDRRIRPRTPGGEWGAETSCGSGMRTTTSNKPAPSNA